MRRATYHGVLDPRVWKYLPGSNLVECKLCLNSTTGQHFVVERRHIAQHERARRHLELYRRLEQEETVRRHREKQPVLATSSNSGQTSDRGDGADSTTPSPTQSLPAVDEEDREVSFPIGDLWEIQDEDVIISVEHIDESHQEKTHVSNDDLDIIPEEVQEPDSCPDMNGWAEPQTGEPSSAAAMPHRNGRRVAFLEEEGPYYPWPSKSTFLTDLLLSSPRLKFSDAQMEAILRWAKAMHAQDVPTKYALDKAQQDLAKIIGNPTERVTGTYGNIFYINNIAHTIAKDYANPLMRFAMKDFPQDDGEEMSQAHHGKKMLLEGPQGIATPAARVRGHIFFVNELVRCTNDTYFIPERFFARRSRRSQASSSTASQQTREAEDGEETEQGGQDDNSKAEKNELMALGRLVHKTRLGFDVESRQTICAASMFDVPYDQLPESDLAHGFTEGSSAYSSQMPNPLRERARGRMCYSVPLIIFMDDVSGNISKQWNKHYVAYMSNGNLPREMLEKEFCVRFVTSSPHASPMELMQAIRDSIKAAADTGITAWDCMNNEEVLLLPYALFFAGDNPMQAELCSHIGLRGNMFCRTCYVGGTKEFKSSLAGYSTLFTEGQSRTPEETQQEALQQLRNAMLPSAESKLTQARRSTGVCDNGLDGLIQTLIAMGKQLRQKSSEKNPLPEAEVRKRLEDELETLLRQQPAEGWMNPLLGLAGVDIHMDTPTEILHTVLLGVVKYFWAQTVVLLEKSKSLGLLQARMEALTTNGLNLPSFTPDYICHYRRSLIGKHFKSLAQVMPYLVYDLVSPSVLDAWVVIGELVVLLWHTKIDNREEYLATLSRTIQDFLNITAKCSPSILITKPKFHFLTHLPGYIRRFGPAILFSTERYESFNHVFRLSNIYSNRQAPSRDTCISFAQQDTVRHVALGGYWYDTTKRRWRHAGHGVIDYMEANPKEKAYLGFSESERQDTVGPIGLLKAGCTQSPALCSWSRTQCSRFTDPPSDATTSKFLEVSSVVLPNGDKASVGCDVIVKGLETNFAKITEMLTLSDESRQVSHICLQLYKLESARHPKLRVPQLTLTDCFIVVTFKHLVCVANVQHNCCDSGCKKISSKARKQERTISELQTLEFMEHTSTPLFLLNTYSIHNYQHIRAALPEALRAISPVIQDSEQSQVRAQAVNAMFAQKHAADQIPPFNPSSSGARQPQRSPSLVAITFPSSTSTHSPQCTTPSQTSTGQDSMTTNWASLDGQGGMTGPFPFDHAALTSANPQKKKRKAPMTRTQSMTRSQRVERLAALSRSLDSPNTQPPPAASQLVSPSPLQQPFTTPSHAFVSWPPPSPVLLAHPCPPILPHMSAQPSPATPYLPPLSPSLDSSMHTFPTNPFDLTHMHNQPHQPFISPIQNTNTLPPYGSGPPHGPHPVTRFTRWTYASPILDPHVMNFTHD